jgi:hypothetical protein
MRSLLLTGLCGLGLLMTCGLARASDDLLQLCPCEGLADAASDPITLAAEAAAEAEKRCPVDVALNYYLVSDYIFRGINRSEYRGEGREDLNHQWDVTFELPLDKVGMKGWGTIGYTAWFEYFAGQEHLTGSANNLQEIDHTIYWTKSYPELYSDFTFGWTAFVFPNVSGGVPDRTFEFFMEYGFHDRLLWKQLLGIDENLINPTFFYAHDYDITGGGAYFEFAFSHEFNVGKLAASEALEDLTVTPSWALALDHRYLGPISGHPDHRTDKFAFHRFGLDVAYRLTDLLHVPAGWGDITISGQLYFQDAIEDEILNDEFYGGMTLSYAW